MEEKKEFHFAPMYLNQIDFSKAEPTTDPARLAILQRTRERIAERKLAAETLEKYRELFPEKEE